MAFVLLLLAGILSIGAIVCFVMVIIQMFKHDDATMGIICLVLLLCGIGGLVAFVMGWINVGKYQIQNIMYAWTGCIVGAVVLQILAGMFVDPGAIQ